MPGIGVGSRPGPSDNSLSELNRSLIVDQAQSLEPGGCKVLD
jgi:hypothetical protein